MASAKLQLNGQDRFSVRDAAYFNLVNFASKSNEVFSESKNLSFLILNTVNIIASVC